MSSRRASSIRTALAVVAAAAAVAGADVWLPAQAPAATGDASTGTPSTASTPETRPRTAATVVCPDVAAPADGPTSTLITTVSDSAAGGPSPGTVSSAAPSGAVTVHHVGSGTADASTPAATSVQSLSMGAGRFGGVVLTASGDAASGFTAAMTSDYGTGATAGLAGMPCLAPTDTAYLVGPATTAGHDPRLVLVNPDPTPSTVDVALATDGSPFSPDTTHAVTLAPYGTQTVALVDLAPEAKALAVRVQTRSGRVTAAVRDRWYSGSVARGVDWLTAGAGPQTSADLVGVGGPAAQVTVVLAATSQDAGTVVVTAVGPNGTLTPAGLEAVDLQPGAVIALTVPAGATNDLTTLHLTSDVPFVASAVTARSLPPAAATPAKPSPAKPTLSSDIAWTPSAQPLTDRALVLGGGNGTTLAITSTGPATSVTLRALGTSAAPDQVVQVPSGRTVSVPLAAFASGVVVTPATPGVVDVAQLVTTASGTTADVVTSERGPLVVPPASPDIRLGAG